MPKVHHYRSRQSVYTKNQIAWGLVSLVLFFGTIIYLNIKGLTQSPKWFTAPTGTPHPSSSPQAAIQSKHIPIQNDLRSSLLYSRGDTLYYHSLLKDETLPVATISGERIHDVGTGEDGTWWLLAGSTDDTYESLYTYAQGTLSKKGFPAVPSYAVKPVLSRDLHYLYWWTSGMAGRQVLMVSDLMTGTQQELVQSSIPVLRMGVSPSGQYMVIISEMVSTNQSRSYVLGIFTTSAKNINLFPSVEVSPDTQILFSEDSRFVFIDTQQGIAAVSLLNGKVISTMLDTKLLTQAQNSTFWIVKDREQQSSCRKGLINRESYRQLHVTMFDGQRLSLQPPTSISRQLSEKNLSIAMPLSAFSVPPMLVLRTIHGPSCQVQWFAYDEVQRAMNEIDLKNLEKLPTILVP